MMYSLTDAEYAQALDHQDELTSFRDEFIIGDPERIYLDGNSLGRLPRRTADRLQAIIAHEWGERLISSWNESWISLAGRIGEKIAPLLGAKPEEVIIADSTSVNLFKLAVAALRVNPDRTTIISDDLNFPSDLYILDGITSLFGSSYELKIIPSPDGIMGPVDRLADVLNSHTALLTFSHTVFKSGYVYDLFELTRLAHENGALILWDVSHSVGSVPLALHDSQVDLAVGCTYKYLNGGPGSPAFLYVHEDLQDRLQNPISGWFSQKNQFEFNLEYQAELGIRRFLTGTPAILSLAAVEDGVDLLLEAGIERLRRKSIRQSEYFISLWRKMLRPLGFRLNSPQDPARRGSHISIAHPQGFQINRALVEEMRVVCDFRSPDNLRFGFAPIYNSYMEIYQAVTRLHQVAAEKIYQKYPANQSQVP